MESEISPSTIPKQSPYRNISPRYNLNETSPKIYSNKFDRVSPLKLGTNPNAVLPGGVNLTRALKLNYKMDPGESIYMTMDRVRIRRASLPEIMTT